MVAFGMFRIVHNLSLTVEPERFETVQAAEESRRGRELVRMIFGLTIMTDNDAYADGERVRSTRLMMAWHDLHRDYMNGKAATMTTETVTLSDDLDQRPPEERAPKNGHAVVGHKDEDERQLADKFLFRGGTTEDARKWATERKSTDSAMRASFAKRRENLMAEIHELDEDRARRSSGRIRRRPLRLRHPRRQQGLIDWGQSPLPVLPDAAPKRRSRKPGAKAEAATRSAKTKAKDGEAKPESFSALLLKAITDEPNRGAAFYATMLKVKTGVVSTRINQMKNAKKLTKHGAGRACTWTVK